MGERATQLAPGAARALRGTLLALIIERPSHGYELAARLSRRLGPSWQVTPKQIYPLLDQLQAGGLVTGAHVAGPDRSRQTKTVYSPTEAARDVLDRWMESGVEKGPLREEMWARVACAGRAHAIQVLDALDRYERQILEQIEANDEDDPPVRSWSTLMQAIVREQTDAHLRGELMMVTNARRRIKEFVAGSGDR